MERADALARLFSALRRSILPRGQPRLRDCSATNRRRGDSARSRVDVQRDSSGKPSQSRASRSNFTRRSTKRLSPSCSPYCPRDLRIGNFRVTTNSRHGPPAKSRSCASSGGREATCCLVSRPAISDSSRTVKILGSAQRRYRGAILQHGSLLLEKSPHAPELAGWSDITDNDTLSLELIDGLTVRLTEAFNAPNSGRLKLCRGNCNRKRSNLRIASTDRLRGQNDVKRHAAVDRRSR